MERISKSDFINKCNRKLEEERIRLDVYNAIESVIEANKDKQMNVRIARKIEDAIVLPDSFSVYASICAAWYDSSSKRGIKVCITPPGQNEFYVEIPYVIEKQKLNYEEFRRIMNNHRTSTAKNVKSLEYAINNLDEIISQSKKLLVEMKDFYCNIPYCMNEYLLRCDIYDHTSTILAIY